MEAQKIAPALAAAVTVALSPYYDKPIVAEMASGNPNQILNLVNNGRSKIVFADPKTQDASAVLIQRIIKQPVFSGTVKQRALYIPVDNFITGQSTMVGLMDYIRANNGIVTRPVMAYASRRCMTEISLRNETFEFLLSVTSHMGSISRKRTEKIIGKLGLSLSFDNFEGNNLANAEMFTLACFFADSNHDAHRKAYEGALRVIGGSAREMEGSSLCQLYNAAPSSVPALERITESVLRERDVVVDEDSRRFRNLVDSRRVIMTGAFEL